jgi:lactoylglutathione lyase
MDDLLSWTARCWSVKCTRYRYILLTDEILGMAALGTSKGLLELYHIPADSSTPYASGNDYSAPGGVGFGHIGFTVPDVTEALERIKSFGFEVIKPLDEAKEEQMGLPEVVVLCRHGSVPDGYKHVFKQLAFVKDPDVSIVL